MTERQRRFCENFLVCGNAKQAMLEAGYTEKSASSNQARLLKLNDVRGYLSAMSEERTDAKIAKAEEVLEFLTAVMRGEEGDYRAVKQNGETAYVRRPPTLKERMNAAAMIGKRYALFTERISFEDAPRVVFFDVDIPE